MAGIVETSQTSVEKNVATQSGNRPFAQKPSIDYSQVGQPLSKIYTTKQHGGHNQNWTSIQTADGLIYVGHTTGISQWDGEQWFNFSTPHATPVRSIAEFQGSLFFGTTNNLFTLKLNHAGELEAQSLFAKLAAIDSSGASGAPQQQEIEDFGEVWSTSSNADGVVFVSSKYTFFFDGQTLHRIPEAESSKHAVFNIEGDFFYKPRHLSNIFKLQITQTAGGIEFKHNNTEIILPERARVMKIIRDADGNLVIVTERHGVFKLSDNKLTRVLAAEQFAEEVQLYDAILSSDGLYYISSTYSGLFILDAQLNIVRHYLENDGISMDTVFSVNEDMQGNIWLTGIPNVVKMRPPHIISQFKAGNTSTEILRLKSSPMGVLATGNGQFVLTMPSDVMQTPEFMSMSNNLESSIDLLQVDDALLRSGYGGIYELSLDASGSRVVTETKLLEVALGRPMVKDAGGNVLAGSSDGAYLLSRIGEGWQVDTFAKPTGPLISLTRDNKDTLWFGSPTSELFKLDNISENGLSATVDTFTQTDGLGFGPVTISNINGQAIFSSAGKLFVFAQDKLQEATLSDTALPIFNADWLADSELIDPIVQTPKTITSNERIWYRKNGRSGYFEKNTSGDWLEHTAIFDAVEAGGFNDLFVDDYGILWFVRDKAEIYRVNIELAEKLPPVALLNIRRLQSSNENIAFKLGLNSTLQLQAQQNDIRFAYASTDTSSPTPLAYRSRLVKNNDATWSSWSQETYRDFTQLLPADYTFEVQAIDAWQRVSPASVKFTIIAPWYLSKTAFVFYIVFGLFTLFLFAYVVQKWRTRALEAANLVLERKVEERTKEVSEKVELLRQQQILKDRFFGNVSHEFRTPLTLTIGPLEAIVAEHKAELSQSVSHLVKTALNNASKMLALVGQVLDMNRLEAGKLPLRVAQYDIAELLRNISERFDPWAQQHKQNIQVLDCDEPLLLWFDMDQLDKCVSNLLSNAIKYSGEGTLIQVQLVSQGKRAEIRVRDNGVGISDGAKDKVFERFYQDKSSENISAPGTGIGLALVKEIMDIHHGDAHLLASTDKGCCFVLSLLTGNKHFDPKQIIEPIEVSFTPAFASSSALSTMQGSSSSVLSTMHGSNADALESDDDSVGLPTENQGLHSIENEDVTTLLIVDDNQELLNFISLRLSASYRIIQAINGQEGYEKACEALPDLIISDVNMPVMTGLDLAKKIKANKQTRTIPIILLTAKATKREVVEGFSVGADDYLTKPFDTSELIMRVNAQINARKLVRETYAAKAVLGSAQSMVASLAQTKATASGEENTFSFSDKVIDIIESQLTQPTFNVEQLATRMHMSRDTLIRKCKKECSETPLNLIVGRRMQKADALLQQQSMSVSEVAYACGFESLAYFSKSYKKHRGISPSEVAP